MAELDESQFDESSFFEGDDKESLITKETRGETNPDLYRVSLDMETVKNKTYSARGRFMKDPRFKGPDGFVGKVHKKMYYMIDPDNTDRKMYVECPSNWGVPTSQNIVSVAFFQLRETDSVSLKRIANQNFGQLWYWWSLFQILIDEQQPDLQGKIKIIRYGKPLNEIIESAVKGDEKLGKAGAHVFHVFDKHKNPKTGNIEPGGKDFFLKVFEKTVEDKDKGGTKKFPSMEKSEFDTETTGMLIDGERVKDDPAGRKKVIEYITSNAPELKQMETVKWDEAMEEKVIASMRITIGDDQILDQIIASARKGVRRSKVVISQETREKLDSEKSSQSGLAGGKSKTEGGGWSQPEDEKKKEPVAATATEEASFSEESSSDMGDGLPDIETEFEQEGLD